MLNQAGLVRATAGRRPAPGGNAATRARRIDDPGTATGSVVVVVVVDVAGRVEVVDDVELELVVRPLSLELQAARARASTTSTVGTMSMAGTAGLAAWRAWRARPAVGYGMV